MLLLAALLPLRGWAMVAMPAMPLTPHLAIGAELSQTAQPHHGSDWLAAAMPCHGTAEPDSPAMAGADDTGTAAHTCASCALCHSAIAADDVMPSLGTLQLAEARGLLPARDTGRLLIATLERPPRMR